MSTNPQISAIGHNGSRVHSSPSSLDIAPGSGIQSNYLILLIYPSGFKLSNFRMANHVGVGSRQMCRHFSVAHDRQP